MVDVDVVIVGGGPGGVSTALFAAAEDPAMVDRIVVIERGRYPREKICAGALGGRADRALAEIGVHVEVPERIVRGVSVSSAMGSLAVRRDAPIGRVVRRRDFDSAFAEEAKARGVRFLEGSGVVSCERRSDSVRLTLDDGRELRARVVVGADGVGSVIRRSLGIRRRSFYAQAIEVDTPAGVGDPDSELLHFDATDRSLRGYVWDFPTLVDDQPMVCRGVYELRGRLDGRGREASDGPRGPGTRERLLRHLERRGIDSAGLRFKHYSERALSLHEPIAVPRAMLVGEAAGIDALLGEGIAQAILYGKTAGPYLARALRRGEYDFADWPRVLSSSTVGLDLRLRARMAGWIYDDARPLAERFITRSQAFATAGIHYFAGDKPPLWALARSALGLAQASVQGHPFRF